MYLFVRCEFKFGHEHKTPARESLVSGHEVRDIVKSHEVTLTVDVPIAFGQVKDVAGCVPESGGDNDGFQVQERPLGVSRSEPLNCRQVIISIIVFSDNDFELSTSYRCSFVFGILILL